MPKKLLKFNLDFIKKDSSCRFSIKQFDDCIFEITPYENMILHDYNGCTAKLFVGLNKDVFIQDTGIVVSENKITVTLAKGISGRAGLVVGEIELSDANGVIASTNFVFSIDKKVGEGAVIPDDIEGLVERFERMMTELRNEFNQSMVEYDEQAGAKIIEIENDWSATKEQINTDTTNKLNSIQSDYDLFKLTMDADVDAQIDAMLDATETNNTKVDTKLSELQTDYDATKLTFTNTINGKVEEIDNKLIEADSKLIELESDIDNAIKRSDDNVLENTNAINQLISDTEADVDAQVLRIDTAIGAGTVDLETKDARTDMDGVAHANLRARLERDLKKGKEISENVEGSYITVNDTVQGAITDIEVIGNTWQDPNNLANIVSAGIVQDDGQVKMSILSCGKVIIDGSMFTELGEFTNGEPSPTNFKKRCPNYINIHPNKVYRNNQNNKSCQFVWYDKDKQFLSANLAFNSATSPSNARYLRIALAVDSDFTQTMFYQGDSQLTSYEPYQFNKTDIVLPCSLEGLESGRDRLYYDKEEKAWCVDKSIITERMNDYTTRKIDMVQPYGLNVYYINYKAGFTTTTCISNKFKQCDWSTTSEGFYIQDSEVVILSNIATIEEFNAYIQGMFIKYADNSIEKIILPLDTQIALNSFFGTTNAWIESGEVDGIIKGKVPKSLASSLQSAHTDIEKLDTRVKNIEGLQESQNFKYATNKGHIVCEQTRNGVIDKLKISGRTLNNLSSVKSMTFSKTEANKYIYVDRFVPLAKRNTIYTIIVNVVNNPNTLTNKTVFAFINGTAMGSITDYRITSTTGLQIFTLKTKDEEFPNGVAFRFANADGGSIGSYTCDDIVILEGDYTQNPPSYFEGLASVGDGADKLEVLSRKEDGNLFDVYTVNNGKIVDQTTGDLVPNVNSSSDYIYIDANKTYYSNFRNSGGIGLYDINKKFIRYTSSSAGDKITYTFPQGVKYIRLNIGTDVVKDFIFSLDTNLINAKHKSNKKQILYYDPTDQTWKKPTLREWDTIEPHSDGKEYYHKKTNEIVLISSMIQSIDATGTLPFVALSNDLFPGKVTTTNANTTEILSNKFTWRVSTTVPNSIYHNPGNTVLVLPSNVNTLELAKTYLEGVQIVYQLAQEEVYECAPINLNSYADETMISFSGGAINPHMEFEVTSYISNLILSNRNRVNLLEQFIVDKLITQDALLLTNRYIADTNSYSVARLTGDSPEQVCCDECLYELIKTNIGYGKEYYNRAKMEEIISYYWMDFKICDDMYNELLIMIQEQHNEIIEGEGEIIE